MSVVVLHSTESNPGTCTAVANYLIRHGYESHEVFDPSNDDLILLLPHTVAAKSLVNLPGGVETNQRGGVYQIEIVGRAVDVPDYDDAWYARLKKRLVDVCAMTGTPYVFPLSFEPYPQSYGKNLVRLSFADWLTVEGCIGHQHVPENSHGDPGALDVARLTVSPPLQPATQPPDEEETMPTYILRYGPDHNEPWLAVYPSGKVRWIGPQEVAFLTDAKVPFVDDTQLDAYEHAKQDAGI